MKVAVELFKGVVPKLQKDKLPLEYGQTCVNADLDSMGIQGIPSPEEVEVLASSGPYRSIYLYNKSGNLFWNAWLTDVNCVKSPLANDPYQRIYFDGTVGSGATHPYGTSKFLNRFANDLVSGGAGTHDQDVDYEPVGIFAPTNIAATSAGGGSSGIPATRAYTCTFVNSRGEEGPPGTPDSVTLTNDDDTVNITWDHLGTMKMTAANGYDIEKVRVYMSATTSTGLTDYYYIGEHTLSSESDTGPKAVTGLASQMGEVLSTISYSPPPAGITGIVQLPNGWVAGYVGNRIYVCEPYLPYAWPEANSRDLPYTIIGLGVIGTTIVAITTGYPYLVYGADPSGLRDQQIAQYFPGVSSKSIFSAENTVFYASTDGIVAMTQSGAKNISDPFIKKPQYEQFSPESIVGAYYDGTYFAFSPLNDDGDAGFAIDIQEAQFKTFDKERSAVFINETDASMYVVEESGSSTNQAIKEWRGELLQYLQWKWKSKKFVMPRLTNMAAGRVVIDDEFVADLKESIADNQGIITANDAILTAGGVERDSVITEITFGAINDFPSNIYGLNGDPLTDLASVGANLELTFNLYANGELVFTKAIGDSFAFKMPAGYKCREYEIELIGQIPVRSVFIANTMKELTV